MLKTRQNSTTILHTALRTAESPAYRPSYVAFVANMVTAEPTSGSTPTDTPASPAGSAARLQIRFSSRSRALASFTKSQRPSGTSDLLLPPAEKAVQSLTSPASHVQQSSTAQAPALAADVALDIFATDKQLQLHLQPDLPTESVLPSSGEAAVTHTCRQISIFEHKKHVCTVLLAFAIAHYSLCICRFE